MSVYHEVSKIIPKAGGFMRTARRRLFVRLDKRNSDYLYETPDLTGNDLTDRAIDTLVDAINREDWDMADTIFAMLADGKTDHGSPWEPSLPSADEEANRILKRLYELRHKFEATPEVHEIIVQDFEGWDDERP